MCSANLNLLGKLYQNVKVYTVSEEVGQAGCKASWVPVPNCARDFIDSMAVVERTSLTNMEAIERQLTVSGFDT